MTPPAPTPGELVLAALYRCQEKHGPDAWLCYDCLCRLFLSHGRALATTHAQGREEGLEEAAQVAEDFMETFLHHRIPPQWAQEIAAALRDRARAQG